MQPELGLQRTTVDVGERWVRPLAALHTAEVDRSSWPSLTHRTSGRTPIAERSILPYTVSCWWRCASHHLSYERHGWEHTGAGQQDRRPDTTAEEQTAARQLDEAVEIHYRVASKGW